MFLILKDGFFEIQHTCILIWKMYFKWGWNFSVILGILKTISKNISSPYFLQNHISLSQKLNKSRFWTYLDSTVNMNICKTVFPVDIKFKTSHLKKKGRFFTYPELKKQQQKTEIFGGFAFVTGEYTIWSKFLLLKGFKKKKKKIFLIFIWYKVVI